MKKIILFIALMFLLISNGTVQAQYILSLTISPTNPTTNDTITIYAECAFPSGNCDEHTQGEFINGNIISAFSLHCLGPLTVICQDTDTFTFPPLPAGNYSFIFQLDAGFGSVPCTPGIVPGPSDTLDFVVDVANGIENPGQINDLEISPNPVSEELVFHYGGNLEQIGVTDISGKQIIVQKVFSSNENTFIYDVSNLSKGVYLISITNEKSHIIKRFVKL